jgi:hypothetical protein
VFELLRSRDRWLLIYDNAERPDQLTGLLPEGGGGHLLVTSRWSAWGAQAEPLRVDVLHRDEAITFLGHRIGSDDQTALGRLADALGDLPLALEEAAAYLEQAQVSLDEYLELVHDQARELFELEQAAGPEHPDQPRVATVWSVSLDRVCGEAPATEALLALCAFLAPDIPRELPRECPSALPEGLAETVNDRLAYHQMVAEIGRYSLATVTPTTLGGAPAGPGSHPGPPRRPGRARLSQGGGRAAAQAVPRSELGGGDLASPRAAPARRPRRRRPRRTTPSGRRGCQVAA